MAPNNQPVKLQDLEEFIHQLEKILEPAEPRNADGTLGLLECLANYQRVSPILDGDLQEVFQIYHDEYLRLQQAHHELKSSSLTVDTQAERPLTEEQDVFSEECNHFLMKFRQLLQNENVVVKLRDSRNNLLRTPNAGLRITGSILNTVIGMFVVYPMKKIFSM